MQIETCGRESCEITRAALEAEIERLRSLLAEARSDLDFMHKCGIAQSGKNIFDVRATIARIDAALKEDGDA